MATRPSLSASAAASASSFSSSSSSPSATQPRARDDQRQRDPPRPSSRRERLREMNAVPAALARGAARGPSGAWSRLRPVAPERDALEAYGLPSKGEVR